MIPFEEIDRRLKQLGKTRAWLAETTGRSPDSIRVALAPSAPAYKRTGLLQRALSDAIEREETAAASTAPVVESLPDRLTIEVHPSTMDRWSAAARAENQTTKDWAITELNRAAAAWHSMRAQSELRVAEDPNHYPSEGNG